MATTYQGQIENHRILIIPCQSLRHFIKSIKIANNLDKVPSGIQKLIYGSPIKFKSSDGFTIKYLTTEHEKKLIRSFNSRFQFTNEATQETLIKPMYTPNLNHSNNREYLDIEDLHWLYKFIQKQNTTNSNAKMYLHEYLEMSEIVLPKNKIISRNKELDTRCKVLEAEQRNKDYHTMTKHINNFRRFSDDTISCQIKMMNRHLIAVFQYIISIITGFVFGFLGIEMMTAPLDLGLRLLLGVICGLVVALAELYFLAKALNSELDNVTLTYTQKTLKVS